MFNESLKRFIGTNGLIVVSIKNEEIGITWKDYYFDNIEKANRFIQENRCVNNCYVAAGTYKSRWRNENNISEITVNYADIDNHSHGFSLEQAKLYEHAYLRPLYGNVIPMPSQVLYTGRGFHILFNLKDAKNISKYKQTQLNIYETLKPEIEKINISLGEKDRLKTDLLTDVRPLRIANTVNTESRTYSQVIFNSNAIYTQKEIVNFHGWLKHNANKKKKKADKLKEPQRLCGKKATKFNNDKLKNFKPYNKNCTPESINLCRKDDLKELIHSRNDKGYTQGYRNKLISITVQLLKEKIEDSKELYSSLQAYNQEFVEPLRDSEIRAWCRSSLKKQIYFKTQTIIDILSITKEEQEQLKTLIGRDVRNERYFNKNKANIRRKRNERYKLIKLDNNKKRSERNKKILHLIKQGYTYKQIASTANISTRTIIRIKKQYAESENAKGYIDNTTYSNGPIIREDEPISYDKESDVVRCVYTYVPQSKDNNNKRYKLDCINNKIQKIFTSRGSPFRNLMQPNIPMSI